MTLLNCIDSIASIDSIVAAGGWMLLVAIPVSVAAVAGLFGAACLRRDPASRHAILAVALVAVCVSPLGIWLVQRMGWSGFTIPLATLRLNPTSPVASTDGGHPQLVAAKPDDRSLPRAVSDTAASSPDLPIVG